MKELLNDYRREKFTVGEWVSGAVYVAALMIVLLLASVL